MPCCRPTGTGGRTSAAEPWHFRHRTPGLADMTDARENSRLGHLFRPSPFSRDRAYWLDGHVLRWRSGVESGWLSLSEVTLVQVTLPPAGHGTARCTLRTAECCVHRFSDDYWFGWNRVERHRWGTREHRRATFLGLVAALARRVRKANPAAALTYGPDKGRPFEPEELDQTQGFPARREPVPPERGEDGNPGAA
ncbi:hypothetical protein HNE_1265 [Hyphomonas neptunium ATCC 15444]|uniref:Uncharacterized protein n=2 Tax=Hyphomonas TaxID=85 RepID=Q0C2R0_HYPNA|nr:hypothetical protein HNE_1265 [Hyphomonas neptunium ATCC 15444]